MFGKKKFYWGTVIAKGAADVSLGQRPQGCQSLRKQALKARFTGS